MKFADGHREAAALRRSTGNAKPLSADAETLVYFWLETSCRFYWSSGAYPGLSSLTPVGKNSNFSPHQRALQFVIVYYNVGASVKRSGAVVETFPPTSVVLSQSLNSKHEYVSQLAQSLSNPVV
ncbi:hypothetical protein POM88_044351 [Heracleum sosnowskyi]|uniref:Uncharacterized protein n=1 Tax=Heracleum sosnowskyi TaxID=360622 RepID=A0AAD8H597_9APIA|nr:hypothetical protein POM88_044351 [Heracleum sosnowskyi]